MSSALDVVVAIAGFAVAVFVGGLAIGRLMRPSLDALGPDRASGLKNAGRMIGWLERTLLYGLVLAGAPDAAAIVIAAKSIARFPAFTKEEFAEYYLIGTLMSFIVAAGVGAGVRAILGLRPVL